MSSFANPAHGGIHHLELPVTDLARSTDWYRAVLGARRLPDLDHRRGDGTLFAVILDVPGSPWLGAGVTDIATVTSDSTVCAVSRLTALPGHRDEVSAGMRSLRDVVRQEHGCLAYLVHTAIDDPNVIVVYESWIDQAAMDAHHRSIHMRTFAESIISLADWPPQQELLAPMR